MRINRCSFPFSVISVCCSSEADGSSLLVIPSNFFWFSVSSTKLDDEEELTVCKVVVDFWVFINVSDTNVGFIFGSCLGGVIGCCCAWADSWVEDWDVVNEDKLADEPEEVRLTKLEEDELVVAFEC